MPDNRISVLVPDWPAPATVRACTTLHGSETADQYGGLNLALHVDDDPQKVTLNRRTVASALALPADPVWLEQVHGTSCVDVSTFSKRLPKADAAYSMEKGRVCTVMTADCLPVLVCDKKGTGVAAIHAGWRGLAAGVIEVSLKSFCLKLGIEFSDCIVWLGPAISQKHFEVGADVYSVFLDKFGTDRISQRDGKEIFIEHAGERDKYFCDLYQLARLELQALEVHEIYGGDQCTYEQENRYYSYRRARHHGYSNCGRMANLIWMV